MNVITRILQLRNVCTFSSLVRAGTEHRIVDVRCQLLSPFGFRLWYGTYYIFHRDETRALYVDGKEKQSFPGFRVLPCIRAYTIRDSRRTSLASFHTSQMLYKQPQAAT